MGDGHGRYRMSGASLDKTPTGTDGVAEVTVETEDASAGGSQPGRSDSGGDTPPSPPEPPEGPPPLKLPITIKGQWRRDWRFGREFVSKGRLTFTDDDVRIEGRRSSLLRSALYLGLQITLLVALMASIPVVLITALGMMNASGQASWLLGMPACSFPSLLLAVVFLGWLGRALLQPKVKLTIPWSDLRYVASNKRFVMLSVKAGRRRIVGRIRPRWGLGRKALLTRIRQGRLPGGTGRASRLRYRPVWLDRLVQLAFVLGVVFVADKGWPYLAERWMTRGEPRSGPLAGIPARLTPAQLEMASISACNSLDTTAPRVRNRRVGDHLAWAFAQGGAAAPEGHRVGHLLWKAGTNHTELVGFIGSRATKGEQPDFFRNSSRLIGLSVVVPDDSVETAIPMLQGQGLEGLRAAWCAGHVVGFDLTKATLDDSAPTLHAVREGADLVVTVDNATATDLILPIRRRVVSEVDLFDTCELPVLGGTLGLLPALPERRYRGFFDGTNEQARVYLVPAANQADAASLAIMGDTTRCAVADSLFFAGIATQRVTTGLAGLGPMTLRARTWTRERRWLPLEATPDQVVDAISARYRELTAAMGVQDRPDAERAAVNQGFLDAMEWTLVLDSLSFQHSLPQVERLRQRLSDADSMGHQGELFLFALAEAFLERVEPNEEQFRARYEVGSTWLEVAAGHTWSVDGRAVTVPDEVTAGYYQVVGRFVLMDLARRIEQAVDHGDISRISVAILEHQLDEQGIILDFHKSSTHKALDAWAGGDFGYLLDRAWSKVQEAARDEEAAVEAARSANYTLHDTWSGAGGAARYAELQQNGRSLGWVALFDQQRVVLDYRPVAGSAPTRRSLAGGEDLLLATSGSYVTPELRTSGLSFTAGHVQNFLISPKMHGLVVTDDQGQLTMLDMKKGGELPGLGRPIRPLESLADFHTLLGWLRSHRASAFQTHLLADRGALTIDKDKADPTTRERRLLVKASYGGNPIIAVVDIPGDHKKSLAEAAEVAMQALITPEPAGPGFQVEAIANLDVGSYDILQAWSANGELRRSGPVALSEARNLVTIGLK